MMRHKASGRWLAILFTALLISCRPATGVGSLPDFTELVEKHGSAVVNISTIQKAESRSGGPQQRLPDIFRHFFEDFGEQFEAPRPDARSQGSGFIISADGYILTNYHVVGSADRILVRMQDRRELEAELVGVDERSDLALLKIEENDLPVVKIGSSKNLRVGEWVLAIGAPFGFESTVTAGIVSAKGRSLPSESYVPFIQTDVAINPGNSGGPLFNLEGEVVGINSQIISRSGGFMGLSFAIPIDIAMDVVAQLRESGRVARGWLGVLIQDVDRDLAESFGLDRPAGALVAQVLDDSPAEAAGLKAGDVVLTFNGVDIQTSSQLPHVVGLIPPGTRVRAEIMRDGKRETLRVEVGDLPEDIESPRRGRAGPQETEKDALGITVTSLSDAERRELGGDGVKVTAVEQGAAARAGIRQGDIIQTINRQPVTNPEQLRELVAELPRGRQVPVLISRGGSARFMTIRLDED